LEPRYELIVFLRLDPTLRMERLRRRESAQYGARIEPGGDMAMASRQFLEWAAAYETAGLEQFRTLATHEQWLTKHYCADGDVIEAGGGETGHSLSALRFTFARSYSTASPRVAFRRRRQPSIR